MDADTQTRLTAWFATQLPAADHVRLEGLEVVEFGHSAETLLLTVVSTSGSTEHREAVVLRSRPVEPGLLPPYDLQRQFDVLRGLEGTAVRSPRALWYEPTGDVLGRDFFVMARLEGVVHDERTLPDEIASDPARVLRMTEEIVDQVAAIHNVDLQATGLDAIAEGRDHLDREMHRWTGLMREVQRGELPALESLIAALKERQPEPCPRITLVHGDAKPGNFAFVGDEISAVFDWELATVGDPRSDLGWMELLWRAPMGLPALPGALTIDEVVARWETLTGIRAEHREWHRAFQGLKTAVIMLSGSMLFDSGYSDDPRFEEMGFLVHWVTRRALRDLGLDPDIESGPVKARQERVDAVHALRAAVSAASG